MLALTISTWVLAGIFALAMAMAGAMKFIMPTGGSRPMVTLEDYTPAQVRWIGAAEVIGAVAIVVAPLFGQPLFWLAPAAAFGLALIQFLAIFAHIKHNESYSKNVVLMVVGLVIAALWVIGA